MSYQLKNNESFSEGIKRIVIEQIDTALDNLKPTVRNKDEAIRDARVCIKKIRAVLRLIRDSLGKTTYEEEDAQYRDAAQKLSKVRDSAAMIEITNKLVEHFSDQLAPHAFDSVRSLLRHSRKTQPQDRTKAMTAAARSLRETRKRLQEWPHVGQRRSLSRGLRRVFKNGRAHFDTAYDQPGVKNFHEWRIQVKHLHYQTHVLRPIWQQMMKALEAELKTLAKYLSEDHDLALLRDKVSEHLAKADDRTEIETLVALIDQRRNELEISARVLGTRIYAEKPRAFAGRNLIYWRARQTETKEDPIVLG